MSARRRSYAVFPRLHPLAACLATLLGLGDACATPAHPSGAIVVTNCLDSGAGSLRAAAQAAGPGDPIDLTQLTCGQITLTTGRIDFSHDQLLQGPGSGQLIIDGNNTDRVFNQNTPGAQLAVYGMTLQRGYGFLAGGCIYSNGPVLLSDAVITGCRVFGLAGTSIYKGGGFYAKGTVFAQNSHIDGNEVYTSLGGAIGGGFVTTGDALLVNSTVSGNSASSSVQPSPIVAAGGADIGGTLTMMYSTVADNTLQGVGGAAGVGGGLRVNGPATITNSTISGNTAAGTGGLLVYGLNSTTVSSLVDSTVSGNTAKGVGGIYAKHGITVANSTIAFNHEHYSLGAGLRLSYGIADVESSIIASNTGDIDTVNIGLGIGGGVSGASNLIGPSGTTTLPPDTIQADPHLFPLANNGGPTQTHELQSDSPAINHGANPLSLTNDQRGPGFVRSLGPAPDIGAVEADADIIFANGFD